MASIDIEVDTDIFDTDELVEALSSRLLRAKSKAESTGTDDNVKKFLDLLKELYDQFYGQDIFEFEDDDESPPILSIVDQMKLDHMHQVFEKYSLAQIEAALPL